MATGMDVDIQQNNSNSYNERSIAMDDTIQTKLTYKSSSIETKACIVGKNSEANKEILQKLKGLNIPVMFSDTGREVVPTITDSVEMVFIYDLFEGEDYEYIRKEDCRILGPPAVLYSGDNEHQGLQMSSRPMYSCTMVGIIICFTGFRNKEEIGHLCDLVHHMGGSIRKEISSRVTHLVANTVQGTKYRTAVSLGTTVMTKDWIIKCWETRNEMGKHALDSDLMASRMLPFYKLKIGLYGFPEEEVKNMQEMTSQHGGVYVEVGDEECSHLVIEDNVTELPANFDMSVVHMVRPEWFWGSIQMDACADESLYIFTLSREDLQNESCKRVTPRNKGRKRRRGQFRDCDLSDLLSPDSPLFRSKRKSGSLSGLLLDGSLASPSTPIYNDVDTPSGTMTPRTLNTPDSYSKPSTARHQVAMEMLTTERNYVRILGTILKVFKEPLEAEQRGGPIIESEELKTIFGSVPNILEVHTNIMNELTVILNNWKEECSVGNIILSHADELMKAYPMFVNYFEIIKETVVRCEREKPRFHAFLKICQNKPECGRETLVQLLIRPVQRLPSINLIVTELIKRTPNNNPDNQTLQKAKEALKNVMTHINEDKRKTENQVQMFEILNDVDGIPAFILSSHRNLLMKADMYELGDNLCGKGEPITMFLFNDSLEVTKRRNAKGMNSAPLSLKSPATRTPQKAFKHVEFIPLSQIMKVLDIKDTDDCVNNFCLIYRCHNDVKDKMLLFKLASEDVKKEDFLQKLGKSLANTSCMTDTDTFIASVEYHELQLTKSDLTVGTISRAVRAAKKTSKKVSRAFSMNKTPKKPIMKRSASSVTPSKPPIPSSPLVPSTRHNQQQSLSNTIDKVTSGWRIYSPSSGEPKPFGYDGLTPSVDGTLNIPDDGLMD